MVIWLRKILIHTIWLLSLSACNPESTNTIESQAAAIQSQELDLTGIPPEKIVITPADFSFAKGERIKFRAAGIFLKGLTQVLEKNLSWQSSDTQILSIDSEGSAVASGEGEATITVTYLGVSSSSKATVSAAEVMQVLILPQTINLELALRKGTLQASTFDLQATGLLTDGSLIDLGDEVEWVLDEDSGLSLDPLKAGRFNALMPGNWTIKAVYGVLQSQKVASIKGQKKVIVGIKTAVSPLVIRVGQSAPLSILAIYNDGTEAPLQEAWAFTKTSEILSRQGGNIVGLKSGSERLTIKSAAFQASIDVYVEEPSITSLSISPSSFILHLGESASFEVTANYSDGTSANVTSSMTASSSDPAKLSLINANSKVQGNAQGSANLIVSYRNKQAQALAAIDNPVLARLEIRPSSLTVASGVMADFQVYGIYTNGTETNLSAVASAQATSIARAEVPTGMPGKLLGKNPGTTSLSAAYVDPSTTRNITGNASVT
ncbi:MAG: hypothetical protein NTX25_05645, partial [Proteobacteria bacterium]|nr:hypothetical protein [Pseudomonadota bacterium]